MHIRRPGGPLPSGAPMAIQKRFIAGAICPRCAER
ncbi:YheV family putative metal-binding protein [Halomonas nitroreducens]